MINRDIRIGVVSSYDENTNTASILYQDRNNETLSKCRVLAPFGIKQNLVKGESVLVAHLSNANVEAIVIAPIGSGNVSISSDDDIKFSASYGSVSINELIKLKESV